MKISFIILSTFLLFSLSSCDVRAHAWAFDKVHSEEALSAVLKKKIHQKVTIAIIDTGIDQSSDAFKSIISAKSRNFLNDQMPDQNLADHHGHGTHVAGLIHSINPQAQLLILKYWDPRSPMDNTLQSLLACLRYAIEQNVDIINYSGGGSEPSVEEKQLIELALQKNILIVAAAGNNNQNSSLRPFFPASYAMPNILSVGSITETGQWAPTSNWSAQQVHIAAPGQEIASNYLNGQQAKLSGTSQATAIASGVASLVISSRSGRIPASVLIKHIQATGTLDLINLNKTKSGKVINAERSVRLALPQENALGLWVGE